MSTATPRFWAGPIRYCRWAARERPAYFWSVVVGAIGPISLPIVPPIRHYFGDFDAPPIPVTYPGKSNFWGSMVIARKLTDVHSASGPKEAIKRLRRRIDVRENRN